MINQKYLGLRLKGNICISPFPSSTRFFLTSMKRGCSCLGSLHFCSSFRNLILKGLDFNAHYSLWNYVSSWDFFSFQVYLSPFYSWITLTECLLGPKFCVWLFLLGVLVAKNFDLLPGEMVSCKLLGPKFPAHEHQHCLIWVQIGSRICFCVAVVE